MTTIAASLCCITPVLALIAGTNGLASTFSWFEPFRPYFIGLTILFWFCLVSKVETQKADRLQSVRQKKTKIHSVKMFLGIVTAFANRNAYLSILLKHFLPKDRKANYSGGQINIQKSRIYD